MTPAGLPLPRPADLARDILAGLVASLVPLANCFTFAALIFSGPWHGLLGQGIAMMLIGGAVTGCIAAATSGFRLAVAAPISLTSALMATMMGGLAEAMQGRAAASIPATAFAAMAAATLATGSILLALGAMRLGKAVRYIPYPVVAGFMGATGWLMTTGAVRMAAARQADAASSWLADPQGAALLAGLAGFTLILLLLTQRVRHPLAIPLALAVAILATDGGLYLSGIPFATARAAGLLFDVAGHSVPTLPLFSGAMVQADWDAILQAAPGFAPVAVLSIVQTLVTAASLEFTLDTEADLDRELRSQGAANVASAMLGGTLGFVSTAYTAASIAAHGRGRVAGVTAGLVMLACLAGGGILIAGIPRFVLGGLLALLGVRLLWDWVVASRRRMPRHEWLLTVAVVAITALAGVLPALLVGLVGSCVLIALSMSRVAVVRREYGIHEGPSSLQRSEEEMRVLAARGGEARVLELGGLAFFGSAYRLYAEVKEMLAGGRVRILVLDFSTVLGIDSSAAAILGRIRSLVRNAGATLIVSGLDAAGARALGGDGGAVALHRTLDEAVEAAEAALLERHAPPPAPRAADWLARALGDGDMARALAAQLSVARYAAGEVLCRQGEAASTMFFIGSGRVSVWVEAPGQPDTRVRVFGANTIAGELGFFLGAPRNATLRVEREAWVGQLGRAEFDALAAAEPGLAVALMEYLARVQAERLSFATRQIVALRR